jgi:hypothetical protein
MAKKKIHLSSRRGSFQKTRCGIDPLKSPVETTSRREDATCKVCKGDRTPLQSLTSRYNFLRGQLRSVEMQLNHICNATGAYNLDRPLARLRQDIEAWYETEKGTLR